MQPNKPKRLLDDCFLHDSDRLRHDEALSLLRDRLVAIAETETVPLCEAVFRILAAEIRAPRNIPDYDNSAVDGYAFSSAGYGRQGATLPVVMRVAAGDRNTPPLPERAAAHIFTGAPMPRGADVVAMQEDCQLRESADGTVVVVPPGLKPGANRRLAGEDVAAGQVIAAPGDRLRPQEIAAIASTGAPRIAVYSRLRIGLVSSGDEIRRPGEEIAEGQVYDSNHYLLRSLLAPLAVQTVDLGILPDDELATVQTMARAARSCDVVLTTGGASRGEEDHLVAALDKLGKRHMWQLAIKPGRPMSFGQIGDTPVFGLPGNPVAAFVCFLLYVRPALILLGGGNWSDPQRFPVKAGFEVARKKTGRREFWRGWLETDAEGLPVAKKFERDGSGLITGLRQACGLIEVDEDASSVKPGQTVRFVPFSEFGIA